MRHLRRFALVAVVLAAIALAQPAEACKSTCIVQGGCELCVYVGYWTGAACRQVGCFCLPNLDECPGDPELLRTEEAELFAPSVPAHTPVATAGAGGPQPASHAEAEQPADT